MGELGVQNYSIRLVHPRCLLLDLEVLILNFSTLDHTKSLLSLIEDE